MSAPSQRPKTAFLLACALLFCTSGLRAQWDPSTPQWSGFGDPGPTERSIHACNDAHGNVFLVAQAGSTLGMQRWDSLGNATWGAGMIVPNASVVNRDHLLVPDGTGGCYLGYVGATLPAGAYVQHLDSIGAPLLPWPGQRVNNLASSFWADLWMVRDSASIYVTVSSEATSGISKVYAQKFDQALNQLWDSTGVILSADTADHLNARCLPDGNGGLVSLYRASFSSSNTYMRMQHVDSAGTALWGLGVKLHTTLPVGSFCRTELRAGVVGDYYACWDGGGNALNTGIYMSRVDSAGTLRWGAAPLVVNNAANVQDLPSMQVDANGEAYAVWRDLGALPAIRAYMQRVDSAGVLRWTPEVVVESDGLNTVFPKLLAGSGGVRVFWTAYVNNTTRILTQIYDSTGVTQCGLPGDTVGIPDYRNIIDDLVLEMPQGGYVLVVSTASFTSGAYVQYVDPPCQLATATADPIDQATARIWPSPTADLIYVVPGRAVKHITVLDLQGRTVLSASPNGRSLITLELDALSPGVYLVLGDGLVLGRCVRQ